MEDPTERWLPIAGYVGLYEISDLGRVRGLDRWIRYRRSRRRIRGRLIRLHSNARDARKVMLYRDGAARQFLVHRLVLETFDRPCPEGQEALHGPAGRNCDWLVNLRWGTSAENARDKIRDGTLNRGERNGAAKLTAADVLECRRRYAAGEVQAALAREFGVSKAAMSLAVRGRRWRHV